MLYPVFSGCVYTNDLFIAVVLFGCKFYRCTLSLFAHVSLVIRVVLVCAK